MFLSSGNAHTLRRAQRASVIDENGIVYSWGNNERNQLNIQELCSDSEEYKTINFVSISFGAFHTLRRAQPWRAEGHPPGMQSIARECHR